MAVSIDSSRTYRWPSELVELVEAVVQADPNNESTWIEWKSTLVLDGKSSQCHHIAKHVLGFSNRSVATARHHAGGFAYMLVGAEPGNLVGVTSVDHAVLRPRIERQVGSAVRWRAEYVTVRGRQVLVVIVDPPQNGDPIHPVRQQVDVHPKGRVLVRRPGSTDPANDFEIDQLVERVRAREGALAFSIDPVPAIIERHPGLPDFDELTEIERAATMARPRAGLPRHGDGPFAVHHAAARAFAAIGSIRDVRSEQDYDNEVARYCDQYKHAIRDRTVWHLWRHDPICLRLEAINPTEDNFADIELEIHVPGEVRPWPNSFDDIVLGPEPVLPSRPSVLGTPSQIGGYLAGHNPSFLSIPPTRVPTNRSGPGFTVRESGSVTINYSGFDLRPHQRRELEPVRLLVTALEGESLNCTWKATASNVRGQHQGGFVLKVCPPTLDYTVIEKAPKGSRTSVTDALTKRWPILSSTMPVR